jgi:chromosome segregation ATPase
MDGSTTPNDAAPSFRSPPRILIPKLIDSRDKWKAKAARRKKELKKAQIRARDLSASRDRWKERALAAEQELQAVRPQLDQAQRQLEQARAEVVLLEEEAKKNRPFPRS